MGMMTNEGEKCQNNDILSAQWKHKLAQNNMLPKKPYLRRALPPISP